MHVKIKKIGSQYEMIFICRHIGTIKDVTFFFDNK